MNKELVDLLFKLGFHKSYFLGDPCYKNNLYGCYYSPMNSVIALESYIDNPDGVIEITTISNKIMINYLNIKFKNVLRQQKINKLLNE